MGRWGVPTLIAAAALIGSGCGGEDRSGGEAGDRSTVAANTAAVKPVRAPAPARATGARITVVDSRFGRAIADRRGEALYLFARERGGKSRCYGACAKVWPPVLTRGRPVAAAGAKEDLLGTTRRADGKLQVTYAGHPLYRYIGDSPGTILCHDVVEFGGTWLVIGPDGGPVS